MAPRDGVAGYSPPLLSDGGRNEDWQTDTEKSQGFGPGRDWLTSDNNPLSVPLFPRERPGSWASLLIRQLGVGDGPTGHVQGTPGLLRRSQDRHPAEKPHQGLRMRK